VTIFSEQQTSVDEIGEHARQSVWAAVLFGELAHERPLRHNDDPGVRVGRRAQFQEMLRDSQE
jgi:hypothetical protein